MAHDGFGEARLEIMGQGRPIPALMLRPDRSGRQDTPGPAILYCHAHGNRWETGKREVLEGRPAFLSGPYGPVLARAGYTVLCVDMPGHGARLAEGREQALVSAALWAGGTLMGRMLGDLRAGLEVLCADPHVDAGRIATLGLSMGATHAYWLGALEPRVAAVAQLCVLADMGPLIAAGVHDLHGPYMTVPGLLRDGDMGDVAGLVAPRPHFVGLGARDPLTPEPARMSALTRLRAAYARAGATERLRVHLEPEAGHAETLAQRAAVLAFLGRVLGAPSGPQARVAGAMGA